MSAPTLVTSGVTAWNTTTTPKSTGSLSVQAGDIIVVIGIGENESTTLGTPTATGQTYALAQSIVQTNYTSVYVWTTTVASTGSLTTSMTRTGGSFNWGATWYVFRGSAGVGGSNKANNSTGTPSVAVTAAGANSAIVAGIGDWNAAATTGKTWLTINSVTPTSGNGLEKVATQSGSSYTLYSAYWSDAGATGSKTAGMSAPSGMQWAIVGIEIKGSSSSTVSGTIGTTFAFSATASGKPTVKGTIGTTFPFSATAVVASTVSGTIATTFAFSATATGKPTVKGTVATTFAFAATATGTRKTRGTIATTFAFSAVAAADDLMVEDPEFPWILRLAPGYDITDTIPEAGWQDYSSRVRGAVSLTVGRTRPGEDAPACRLEFALDNLDGELTPNLVTSSLWPYVDLGLPVQFWRGDSNTVAQVRATVACDSIDPVWPNGTDDVCVVYIVASGPLRWQVQGEEIIASALAGTVVAEDPIGYWPCTDEDGANTAASGLVGGMPAPRTTSGVVFSQVEGPDGTDQYPSLVLSGRISARPATTSVTDRWAVECIALADTTATEWLSVLLIGTTSSSAPSWRLRWDVATAFFTLRAIGADGSETVVVTSAATALSTWRHLGVYVVQSGGNVSAQLWIDGVLAGSGTATSVTTGRPVKVDLGDSEQAGHGMKSVGQLVVFDSLPDFAAHYDALYGYDGEQAHVRWLRLCAEGGIPATTAATTSMQMGPQRAQTRVAALRQCEDSDGGIMTDHPVRGLRYVSLAEMYNQTPAIELNARDSLHLSGSSLTARRDDSTAATDVTITREGGSSRRVMVPARRTYKDAGGTLSLYTDDAARAVASWRAHHGAQTDLRYDAIVWDPAKVPALLDTTLALRPGHLVVVSGLFTQHPAGDVSLILQGWTEIHDLATFSFAAVVSPARLYEIATVGADDPGDWDDTTARIDSDTSTIGGAGGTTSSTSLVVASDYGWSTTAVPYDWDLLGERVRVTAMTAYVGGVQTATVTRAVNGIPKAIPVDTPVRLWRPPVIGL